MTSIILSRVAHTNGIALSSEQLPGLKPLVLTILSEDQLRDMIDQAARVIRPRRWKCTEWTGTDRDAAMYPVAHCGFSRCRDSVTLPTFADSRLVPQPEPDGHPRLIPRACYAPDETQQLPDDWLWIALTGNCRRVERFFCSWRCMRLYAKHFENFPDDEL